MIEETEIKESRENRGSRREIFGSSSRKRRFRAMAFILLAICCTAGAAAGVCLSRQRAAPASRQGLAYEANVVSGDIPGKTREQRQKELDSVVEEGMLAMSMNVTPFGKVTGKDCSVNWMIENPSNQGKLIRVEVTLDDTGEKIFETGAIRPGNYLESGPLMASLPAEEYSCTAVFLAYQEESENLIGQAAVKIKLVLQE